MTTITRMKDNLFQITDQIIDNLPENTMPTALNYGIMIGTAGFCITGGNPVAGIALGYSTALICLVNSFVTAIFKTIAHNNSISRQVFSLTEKCIKLIVIGVSANLLSQAFCCPLIATVTFAITAPIAIFCLAVELINQNNSSRYV